jgi:hypothetical protein
MNGPPRASGTRETVTHDFILPLDRDENQIAVSGYVAGADQTDCVRDAFFELNVGFEMHWHASAGRLEKRLGFRRVVRIELFRHVNRARFEVRKYGVEYLGNGGNASHQCQINRFNLRPKRECSIGDHERIRMPDSAEQVIELRIDNS